MSNKLSSLVEADPMLMIYALQHLGEGVPANPQNPFYAKNLERLRREIFAKLAITMLGLDPLRQLTPDKLDQLERLWTKQMLEDEALRKALIELPRQDMASLRKKLHDPRPAIRSLTIQLIAARHLPLEADLMDLLTDPMTCSIAHDALVRLARGTDFGPSPGASRRGVDRAIAKWRNWLALQQAASADKGSTVAAKSSKADPIQPVQLLLDQDDRELHTQRPEVTRLYEELVNAKDNEHRSILARWREAADNDHTDALAMAIPKLLPAVRAEAEDALTERLSHLPTATLRDKLQDDNMEIRRAAAFACGRKLAKELFPDLVQLLEDPEKDVIQAARASLTELTGEDFGPTKDASAQGRAEAVAAWRKWCKEHAGTTR